jgi:plasmid stability protein
MSMPGVRIRNVPERSYKHLPREARKHTHSLEDEVRDTIFESLIDRHPVLRGRLVGTLSRNRLQIDERKVAFAHLIE